MSDYFQAVREVIGGRREVPCSPKELVSFGVGCYRRLLRAVCDLEGPSPPGPSDLACLVRHVLRREEQIQRGVSQSIIVPRNPRWPDEAGWRSSGVEVINGTPNSLTVRALPWVPAWLHQSELTSIENPAQAEETRRNYDRVPGDACLNIMGLDTYRSSGQRDAVRAVLTAPPGSTLVINLPTGAGKSLCAQLPALLKSLDYGVTVVVVPTTALAIDQERAMASHIDHPTAYYQDGTTNGEERREKIRERVRDGTQRIVFTSPESVLESLTPSLYAAAERGFLRLLVVDEAHMVEQWGDEFRPSFQELPGLRKDLLRVARGEAFITVLMTGTLTEYCLDTLEALYGDPGPFDVISAAQLRPEPSYWFGYCGSEDVRRERVLEAIHHLPRPLIVYATKVDATEMWGSVLRRSGFRRLAVVTSRSSADYRGRVIDDWREGKVDIVVATSAFGLGVDQADVRAVLHACIPETLDRFYQEVGRGGRDGKASISLTLYTGADFGTARGLNRKVTISVERGLQRWRRMFRAKTTLADGRIRVPVDVAPGFEERDINMVNLRNQGWNVRTLTLMCRAGLVEMDAEAPPNPPEATSAEDVAVDDRAYLEQLQERRKYRVLRVRDQGHLNEQAWLSRVEPLRITRSRQAAHNLSLMEEALKGRTDIARLLSEAYRVTAREEPPRNGAVVSPSCGGCPHCRSAGTKPYASSLPSPRPAWRNIKFPVSEEFGRLLRGHKCLAVFYDAGRQDLEWAERLDMLMSWFIRQGVTNVVAPLQLLARLKKSLESKPDLCAFFNDTFEPLRMPPLPTLLFHPAGTPVPLSFHMFAKGEVVRVLILPSNAEDPIRRDRRLSEVLDCRDYKFDELLAMQAI